ncbi:MAG: NADH/ubiquinone/plastoquinone (complex I) [Candidatus Omnitrophica bacterium]|nr:NADH/ubiquinone/plastoquinone (complex I) [Candidatus Omnitrophota bacterium]
MHLFLIIPLAAAFMMAILARTGDCVRDIISGLAAISLAVFSVLTLMAANFFHSAVIVKSFAGFMPPAGTAFVVDGLSAFMLVTVNTVALFVVLYSAGYMNKYTDKWKFQSLFFLMISGINGVLVASDMFNLYVFLEIAAISAYFLVAFGTEAEELEASFKYAVMGTVASAFILLGIAFLYSHTSTLSLAGIAQAIAAAPSARIVQFVSVLFLMGFALKAALVPFHAWLAYAHSSAPAPISAMLSGVLIKVLGIYAIARIFFSVFGASAGICQILIALGVLSMIAGGVLAFGQSDIKRLFAYSTVSQIGYVALALGVATPLAFFGAVFHLFNHSIVKSLLFLNSGSIEQMFRTRDLSKISGVVAGAPVTGYTSIMGAMSISGVPPFGGFWSKLIIIFACLQAGHPVLAAIAVLVSVMTMAYYFAAMTPALFGAGINSFNAVKKVHGIMNVSVMALAVLALAAPLALLPEMRQRLIDGAVQALVNGSAYAATVLGAIK